ncbi:hypothetical protein UlMin_034686, partial [Ulmus minor]
GVSIGPFCTTGSSTKLGNGCKLYPGSHIYSNTELGEHCVLMSGAVVGDDLPGRTVMGCNNVIGHHSVVGIKCQDLKYKPGDECFLDVGNNNEIREYTSIHRSSKSDDKSQHLIGENNVKIEVVSDAGDVVGGGRAATGQRPDLAGKWDGGLEKKLVDLIIIIIKYKPVSTTSLTTQTLLNAFELSMRLT